MQQKSQSQQENIIWTGKPSQAANFTSYLVLGVTFFLIIPIFTAWWKWLSIKMTSYELKTERLRIRSGVLNKTIDDLELYRVVDYQIEQPLTLRFFGKSNIVLATSDNSHPTIILEAIDNAEEVLDLLRVNVEACRTNKMVREITIN